MIEFLAARGWSEARIATQIGVSQPTVHRMRRNPHYRAGFAAGDALRQLYEEERRAAASVGEND